MKGKFLLIGLLVLAIAISGCVQQPVDWSQVLDDAEAECERVEGEWMLFSNGCVDSCYAARNPNPTCTQAQKLGCSCGPDKCWETDQVSGKATCVPN